MRCTRIEGELLSSMRAELASLSSQPSVPARAASPIHVGTKESCDAPDRGAEVAPTDTCRPSAVCCGSSRAFGGIRKRLKKQRKLCMNHHHHHLAYDDSVQLAATIGTTPIRLDMPPEVVCGTKTIPFFLLQRDIFDLLADTRYVMCIGVAALGIRKIRYLYGFVDPVAIRSVGNKVEEVQTYLIEAFQNGGKEVYLAPYLHRALEAHLRLQGLPSHARKKLTYIAPKLRCSRIAPPFKISKNHSLSITGRTEPNSSAASLAVAPSGHILLVSTSAGIRQLGCDQPLTGSLLLIQFLSRLPPHSVSLSNSALLALYLHACFDPLQTALKLGFSPSEKPQFPGRTTTEGFFLSGELEWRPNNSYALGARGARNRGRDIPNVFQESLRISPSLFPPASKSQRPDRSKMLKALSLPFRIASPPLSVFTVASAISGQPKFSNGYGRRKSDREGAIKSENKILSGKLNASRLANTGAVTGSKGASYESPSHDRLVYITTCLIGHQVEVQVKNGSTYSGIFHATNTDKDFGIILKMARITKDCSSRGQKSGAEFFSKPPSKILIIPAKDLVQVTAQDVAIARDGLPNESHNDMHQEIMVDSLISQSRNVDLGRELKPWVPDEDDPQCPELENIFDGHWNRGWDQFETNEALFGVKSTFNEELYTTKLEKGPQTRELEKQALRIAKEIEGEETQDLHLAEERGFHLHEDFDIDEETRFSSVYRGKGADDSGFEEDVMFNKRPSEISGGKGNDGARTLANSSSMDHTQSSQSSTSVDLSRYGSHDHAKQLASELPSKSSVSGDGESRILENSISNQPGDNDTKEENLIQTEDVQLSKSEDSRGPLYLKKDGSDKGLLSANASSYAPSSHSSSKTHEKMGSHEDLIEGSASGKVNEETKSAASSGPALSPSSSVGSLSSEKSTLNPNAKEFKLNPNAKSFIPSPARPPAPVSDGSYYFPTTVATVPSMAGMPMGVGIGPTFAGPQPMMYNPQVAQMPSQAYFHPNAPQYGQLLGHPRQALYMPSYLPEMPYKGRDY
ncbi:unnamed protein product [Sphenostylis stenocarpa]|uniref:LsmAD domain-containing protein n=1 Tax=Sphenostylis stenocarpa TaxID=92480 RepID=A0AA86VDK2_9FABA|nr:unnamed protein product [Sphenostylis stenocarpa]